MLKRKWLSGHSHLKTSWIQYQIYQKDGVLTYAPPLLPSPLSANGKSSSGTRITPGVLITLVVLAILFFVSAVLHLLVRFLTKNQSSGRNLEGSRSDTPQGQLQQLFNLHDSGLDQEFINALPVFSYKEILGPKEPSDCAVCLCGFTENDQLRSLPMCGHAFHINCIDTWLQWNSTCPLCRAGLYIPGFPFENPIFDFDDVQVEDECPSNGSKQDEVQEVEANNRGFSIRLGKYRKLNNEEGDEVREETSSSKLDERRCFSLGSYQYVMGKVNHRVALDRDQDVRLVKGTVQTCENPSNESTLGSKISIGTKTDSYSVSKIWLWSKKGKFSSSADAQLESTSSSCELDLPWRNRR